MRLIWFQPLSFFRFAQIFSDTVFFFCFSCSTWVNTVFSPHHCGVFVFLLASRRPSSAVVRRRPPPRSLTHTSQNLSHHTQVMSHHTQLIPHHTPLISHTTHLTQHSSHTHTHHKTYLILISYNLIQSHTQLISHTSSHTSHHTPLISHTHITKLIIHTPHLIQHITHHSSHTHTHHKAYLIIHKSSHIIHNSSHTQLILHTTHLTDSAWQAQYAELPEEGVARIVAAVAAARCCVAGAVHRAFCRSWGADCRRLGRAFSVRGRRNTQSLLKELRRGLSPAGPRLLSAWQAQYTEPSEGAAARIVAGWAAPSLCVAGAVHSAFWRSCGADCRRLGRGAPLRGRRSTQSLPKELRRGLSPAGPRLLSAWQAQYTEPFEGVVARIVGRRSTQRLLKELGRGLSPAGPRLLSAWQAQYTEPSEGAAARTVAGWAAALLCVAGAVHRASRRSCGADCRRLGRGSLLCGRRSTQSLLQELGRGLWPAGPRLLLRGRRSTQSLLKELRRGLSPARPRLLSAWQAQYTEPSEGAAARIVASWAAAGCRRNYIGKRCLCDRSVLPQLYWRLQRRCLFDRYVSPQLYWRLQRRCLCDRSVSPQLYWRLQRKCLCEWSGSPQLYWRLQRRCLCDRSVSPQLYWR